MIQSFDTSNMKVKVAGELKNFEATEYLDKKDVRKMDKFIQNMRTNLRYGKKLNIGGENA